MIFYPCKLKDTLVTRSKIITKEGRFALDAIENNPNIEGSLADRINRLDNGHGVNKRDIISANRAIALQPNSDITLDPITIPVTGMYLISYVVNICNGGGGTLQIFNYANEETFCLIHHQILFMTIPDQWDGDNVLTAYRSFHEGVQFKVKYRSQLARTTDSTYESTFSVRLLKLWDM